MAHQAPQQGKTVDFDNIAVHTICGVDFKSHNEDKTFDANAIYFRYTKPYKVKVEFLPAPTREFYGLVDVYRYTAVTARSANFDIRPTRIAGKAPAAFDFYANPFYLGLEIGFFEPRVYKGSFNIARIEITKQLEFLSDKYTKYALFLARRARDMLELARQNLFMGHYGLCLHFLRLCIELSLKTIFPAFGDKFREVHDLTKKGGFPTSLRKQVQREMPDFQLEEVLFMSQKHIRPDRFDFYGDSDHLAPADLVVKERQAEPSFQDTVFIYHECMRLVEKKLKFD